MVEKNLIRINNLNKTQKNLYMAYNNDNGCGCMTWIAFILIMGIISCVKYCIRGDIKLPHWGSNHVSGGTGSTGTSNGYNVKYQQTTPPNNNNSGRDYTDTNKYPTEYQNGKSSSNPNSSNNQSSNNDVGRTIQNEGGGQIFEGSTNNISHQPRIVEKEVTCSHCKGTGIEEKANDYIYFDEEGIKCHRCDKTVFHKHIEKEKCWTCNGTGIERVSSIE